MGIDAGSRQYAAALVRRYLDGTCSLEVLFETFEDSEDPLIHAALDLVARQPRRGTLGVTERHWNTVYWPRVLWVLEQLEAGEAGATPPAPLYPVATPLRLLGFALLVLCLFLTAADHASTLWNHANGAEPLSGRGAAIHGGLAFLFGVTGVRALRNLRYRLWLWRRWRGWRGGPPLDLVRPAAGSPAAKP
jgi:hypothetical protein